MQQKERVAHYHFMIY